MSDLWDQAWADEQARQQRAHDDLVAEAYPEYHRDELEVDEEAGEDE